MLKQIVKLTDQAIANVRAADTATLHKVGVGYTVTLEKEGSEKKLPIKDREEKLVKYPSKAAASKALKRHNEKIEISVASQF